MVAHDAAQQSVVGGGDVVVVVEQDGGQCRGVDAELHLFGNLGRQQGVQRMDAFHHEHLFLSEVEFLAPVFLALARLEVVFRKLHLAAFEQLLELLVEQIQV